MAMHEKDSLLVDEQVYDVPQKIIAIPIESEVRGRRAGMKRLAVGAVLATLLLLVASVWSCQPHRHRREEGKLDKLDIVRRQSASTASAAAATGTVLVDYQVHQPVLTPEGATLDSGVSNGVAGEVEDSCQVVLMDYVFAYSYGEPFIGELVPDSSSLDGE